MFMKRGGPPLRRQTSAERALARANQRLRSAGTAHQEEEDSSDNEDDINKYLSSLRKKTQGGDAAEAEEEAAAAAAAPRPGRKKLSLGGDISDISLTDSSEQRASSRGPPRSKFLKARAAPQPAPQPAAKVGAAVGASALQRSAVLAQASRLTGQYARQARKTQQAATRKSSDSELSAPSTDSDLKRQRALSGSGGNAQALYSKSAKAKLGYLTDEESMSFGKDGGKFLKKKEEKKEKEEEKKAPTPKTKKQLRFAGIENEEEEEEDTPRRAARSPKSPSSHSSSLRSDRLRRSPAVTDSDEDMSTAELGEGLLSTSSAPLTPQSPKRRTSLRSPDTPRSAKKRVTIAEQAITMSEEEEEEVREAVLDVSELSFVPEQFAASPDESEEEEEAAPVSDVMSGRAETIMDAADFLDSESDDDDSSPRFAAIRSIDDLSSASSVPEVESEVPSARRQRQQRDSGPRPPSASSASSASSSTSSTVIRSEQRPATSQYSDSDFESVSETERPTAVPESYAADFESATEQSDSYTRTRGSSSSSEETTFTESYTARIQRRRRHRGGRDSDKSVQTHEAGLEFHWDLRHTGAPLLGPAYGMAGVELSPIAHFAVAPEALEAVTAYSPSVVALNNMLRQQLDLTRNFVATQRRLYDAMARTIAPDFSYTTLEATKEYIRQHRPPTLTMEEALREVEAEM